MRTVVGLFNRFEDAQAVVRELKAEGFDHENISLVASDARGEYGAQLKDLDVDDQDVTDGAAAGAGLGAVLGGLGGLLVGLGALAIPGIGPVIAAGPIAAALAGAGIGAVAGGLVGALVDLGIPEEHASAYAEGVRQGGTLVVLRTQDHMTDRAVQIMNRHNPVDINRRDEGFSQQSDMGFQERSQRTDRIPVTGETLDDDEDILRTDRMDIEDEIPVTGRQDDVILPVIEEDIDIGKRTVDRGGVRAQTYTEEENVEKDVNLRKEHIDVERRPVNREATEQDRLTDKEMEFRETEEEPIVSKHSRVVEEVHINKDVEEQKHTVRDTLHHQRVDVDQIDENDWMRREPGFQQHYFSQFSSMGHNYDYYMPAYRYGYAASMNDQYRGRDWDSLEPEFRSDWENRGYAMNWYDVRDAVRYGWEASRR